MGNEAIAVGRSGQQKVYVYPDRFDVRSPRMATAGITKKTESFPWAMVRDVQVSGGTVRVHFGPLSVRGYSIGRKAAKAFLQAFQEFHAR